MDSYIAIIDQWPSIAAFGRDIGVKDVTARAMRARDSIPPEFWTRLVVAAERRRLAGVTYELLAQIAARRKGLNETAA
jgi:hypothetical protein